MRIICPACETTYEVPEKVLAPGRRLRCARCRSDWVPLAQQRGLEPTPPAANRPASPAQQQQPSELPPFGRRIHPPPPAKPGDGARVAVIAGWLASFVAIGSFGVVAVEWRQPIEKIWPPAARAYGLLGLR